ncbi:galactokinase [Demequina sp.]|uniref:galactokinase n=1 Tax=Demequina sp. TaxID=2050685 RepID=UPI003D0A487E
MAEGTDAEGPIWSPVWTPDEGAQHARALFTDAFGYEAKTVKSAPGRVTIVGEHTDYSGGVCLATTTQQETYVAGHPRDDDTVRVTWFDSTGERREWTGVLDDARPSGPGDNAQKSRGIIWALTERGYSGSGMDLAITTCVPEHAGLAQGVSVLAAVALVIQDLWGLALDTDAGRVELAGICIDAETGFSGVPTAGMVQHTILRCPPGQALLLDFYGTPPRVSHQPLYFPEYGLALLLIDTGKPNTLTLAEYSSRWDQVAAASAALGAPRLRAVADAPHALRRLETIDDPVLRQRARHVITEIERVRIVCAELSGTAPAHERFVSIGKALYRSHASMEVDYEMSNPELDAVVDGAFQAGALGARLVEGGFGGAAVALIRRAQAETTARLISESMVASGHKPPTFSMI